MRQRRAPSQLRHPDSSHAGGYVLLEALLAALILAVGLLGLGAMQVAAVRTGAAVRERQIAADLAEGELEALPFGTPDLAPLSFDRDGRPLAPGGRPGFFTVTLEASVPEPGARLVLVRVAWPGAAGRGGRCARSRLVPE